jgi:hypothetical protein
LRAALLRAIRTLIHASVNLWAMEALVNDEKSSIYMEVMK